MIIHSGVGVTFERIFHAVVFYRGHKPRIVIEEYRRSRLFDFGAKENISVLFQGLGKAFDLFRDFPRFAVHFRKPRAVVLVSESLGSPLPIIYALGSAGDRRVLFEFHIETSVVPAEHSKPRIDLVHKVIFVYRTHKVAEHGIIESAGFGIHSRFETDRSSVKVYGFSRLQVLAVVLDCVLINARATRVGHYRATIVLADGVVNAFQPPSEFVARLKLFEPENIPIAPRHRRHFDMLETLFRRSVKGV